MWADAPAPKPAPRVATREAALALVREVSATMAELGKLVEVETAQVRVGRIAKGLAEAERKAELTSRYLQGLEALKANAVALARFAPEALEALRRDHAAFARAIEANQMVLATARAVSEQLVRSLSQEIDRAAAPAGYGPGGYAQGGPRSGPALAVSKSL